MSRNTYIFFLDFFPSESESEVAQSCPTLCNPMDYSLPGSSVHGIFQARVLEWVSIAFSRDLPGRGIEPRSPALWADVLPSEPHNNLFLLIFFDHQLQLLTYCVYFSELDLLNSFVCIRLFKTFPLFIVLIPFPFSSSLLC